MATIPVNDDTPREQYTAIAAQTTFVYNFIIFSDADLDVYVDDVLQTLTTDYTVTGANTEDGGNVVFTSGRSAGEIITIEGNIAIERLSDLQQAGQFDPDVYNLEQDKQTAMMKQIKRDVDRKIGLGTTSTTDPSSVTLPDPDNGKYLGWSSGNLANLAAPVETSTSLVIASGDAGKIVKINAAEDDIEVGIKVPTSLTSSKYGALVVQNNNDDGLEVLSSQGTSGEVLTSAGPDALPTWGAAPPYTQVASGTFSAVTDIEILSAITSSYDVYEIYIQLSDATNDNVTFNAQVTTDNGTSYETGASDYDYIYRNSDTTTTTQFVGNNTASNVMIAGIAGLLTGEGATLKIRVSRAAEATEKTSFYFEVQGFEIGASTAATYSNATGSYQTAAAVNGFRIRDDGVKTFTGSYKVIGIL